MKRSGWKRMVLTGLVLATAGLGIGLAFGPEGENSDRAPMRQPDWQQIEKDRAKAFSEIERIAEDLRAQGLDQRADELLEAAHTLNGPPPMEGKVRSYSPDGMTEETRRSLRRQASKVIRSLHEIGDQMHEFHERERELEKQSREMEKARLNMGTKDNGLNRGYLLDEESMKNWETEHEMAVKELEIDRTAWMKDLRMQAEGSIGDIDNIIEGMDAVLAENPEMEKFLGRVREQFITLRDFAQNPPDDDEEFLSELEDILKGFRDIDQRGDNRREFSEQKRDDKMKYVEREIQMLRDRLSRLENELNTVEDGGAMMWGPPMPDGPPDDRPRDGARGMRGGSRNGEGRMQNGAPPLPPLPDENRH